VDEVLIPEHRSITVEDLKGGSSSPGSRYNPATIFRFPLYAVFGLFIASAPMGAAEATVEHYIAQAKKRVALMTGGALAQYGTQQVRVAEASTAGRDRADVATQRRKRGHDYPGIGTITDP
jgi:3-hydroxy-9,10-secoandrosta-1,3,5(10)-triene-9,17-dione monooxygenase